MPLHEEMRESRERVGLTLQAVHVATRISTDFLNAIEEGNFEFLPKPYIRLFLRTYAKQVGMDPQYVLDRYEEIERPHEEGGSGISTTIGRDRPLSWGVIVGMAIGFALLGLAGVSLFKMGAEDVSSTVFRDPTQNAPGSGVDDGLAVGTEDSTQTSRLNESGLDTAEADATDPEIFGGSESESKPKAPSKEVLHGISWTESDSVMTLRAVCVELTWLDILSDERRVFQGFMEPEDERTWQAREKFSVVSGRSRGVTFSLQDHPLPWVRPGVSGVLRITITRSGVKRERPPSIPLSDSLSIPPILSEPRIEGSGTQEQDIALDDNFSARRDPDPPTNR